MLGDVTEFDLASVFDGLDVGIIVLDDRCRVVGWNDWIAMVGVAVTSIDRFGPKDQEFPKKFPRWNRAMGWTVTQAVGG